MNRVKYVNLKKENIMKLEAIIFDIDGTLWNTTDYVAESWNQAGADFGAFRERPISGADLRREFGKPMDIIVKNLFPEEEAEIQEKIWKKCKEYEENILKNLSQNLLYPNVKETLQMLSQTYQIFIVSNCQDGYIPLFLEKNGLQEYVTDYESFGATLRSKGENIRLVMERNGIKEAIYVGDTKGDYEATKEAEIPFIFARYGFGEVENPKLSVDNIAELPEIVENLANPNCDNC